MGGFHPPPHTKTLSSVFQLAMIASDYYEQGQKACEGRIPKLVPPLLEERDAYGGADQEDGEPPSGKSRAGLSGAIQETIHSRQKANEGIFFRLGSMWRR